MSSQSDVASLLARFPGPISLARSRRKWALLLLGGIVFVVLGFFARQDAPWSGLFGIAFFGFGTLISAAMLMPHAGGLVLDDNGFEVTNLFRRRRSSWADVSAFIVVRIPPAGTKVVAYDDVAAKGNTVARMNSDLTGRNSALPDSYGLTYETLADLMTQWSERARQRRS